MFTLPSRTRLRCLARGILVLAASTCTLPAQLVDWDAAIAASAGQSTFTTVEATVDNGMGLPAVLVAGHFTGNLAFGPLPNLTNGSGQDGVVARLEGPPATPWDVAWKLQATSNTGDITITDLAVDALGNFYLCGTFSETANFGTFPLTTAPGATEGFIAWGDAAAATPSWQGAFLVPDMLPSSLAVGADGATGVVVTGPGAFPGDLARLYDPATGTAIWATPAPLPNAATQPTDIALSEGPGPPQILVLAEDPAGSTTEGLVLYQLNPTTGIATWNRRLGSTGLDLAGGLATTPMGETMLAFSSDDPAMTYDAVPLPGIPTLAGRHAVVLRIDFIGSLVWSAPLGIMMTAGSEMRPSDLAVDDVGNAYLSAVQNGSFEIEEIDEAAAQDAVILGVDGTGLLFEYQRSTGGSTEHAHAISAPARDLLVTVGDYTGATSTFGGTTLPAAAIDQGFVAIAAAVDGQELFILEPDPPLTVSDLRQAIHQDNVNGQVYHEILSNNAPSAVSAYLTPDQILALTTLLAPNTFTVEVDLALTTKGTTSTSGWALGHLNDAASAAATYSYTYPDTTETVYVYLIDTAVGSDDGTLQADLDTWFGGNTNLTLETTTLIRGAGDPTVSSVFEHGTKMASLIAGPETGSGVGVPIVVKNFDFYPNGATTTASLLADAIDAATTWHDSNTDCAPGVIVVASGSVASGSSSTITTYLKRARDDYHLASIVSAGNESDDTASYSPAENGGESGIICAAASTESETVEACSNEGTEVDLYAPGDAVRVVDFSDPTGGGYQSLTGTSASAALTCGVAAIHLGMNPWLSPEDLETELTGDTATVGTSPNEIEVLEVATTGPDFTGDYDMWAEFHELTDDAHSEDDDGDGWSNLDEYFHGLNPCDDDPLADPLTISYTGSTGDYTVEFKLNAILVDSTAPATLLDGSTLEITDSTDALTFTGPTGTPSVGSTGDGRTTMSYTDTASATECLFRLEITPSTPSP